ncbi:MAG: alpha/beta hydrolase, partial [Proteobacteria bacterium]|nr:alpha/beta hydrolase [Pseudomonadota bacterium]
MKLYLHAGPGLSAAMERQWFGTTLPVHWWDQPVAAAADAQPYRSLLDAARAELVRLADTAGRPVDVIAHSFG